METEFNDYIPVVPKENGFFDGFDREIFTMITSLGIPSNIASKNSYIYSGQIILGKLQKGSNSHRYNHVRIVADFELEYEKEEFEKVNWKEEGF